MPWSVRTPTSQRRDFVEDAARGHYAMRELCARYGISPRVGYKWLARYEALGLAGLGDQSRRPQHSPTQLAERDPALAALVVAARQRHPTWGPRKLLAYLARRHHRQHWPAASTVGALLKRQGLVPRGAGGAYSAILAGRRRPWISRTPSGRPTSRGSSRPATGATATRSR